jgi:hypothetical protein
VERIVTHVAQFGIGVPWEDLDPIGPFELPGDPQQIVHASLDWTPQKGGHRCLRAEIHVRDALTPLRVGRNLDVIQASEHEHTWRIPFQLGNPEGEVAPIMIRMAAEDDAALEMALHIAGRPLRAGEPVWLRPGEVVPAELELHAAAGPALEAVRAVEGFIAGRLIDGVQVMVSRPAVVQSTWHTPDLDMVRAREPALALVR